MDMKLRDRVALVTGGSRGIGRAIAAGLAAEGCHLAIAARGEADLEAAGASLRTSGVQVLTLPADLMDPAAPARLIDATQARFGRLDVLVANAGGTLGARDFPASSGADWAQTFQLNVLHATDLLRMALPLLRDSDAASAIFVASISGRAPTSRGASYAATKAALIHAARSLAWELAPDGVRVNALSPGSTLFEDGGWDRTRQRIPAAFATFERSEFPRGHLNTVEEVADAAVFLASPRSMGLNATDLQVDGGQRRPSM